MALARTLLTGAAVLALAVAGIVIPSEPAHANVVCLGNGTTAPTITAPATALEGNAGDTNRLWELVVSCGPTTDPVGSAWELAWDSVAPLPLGMSFDGQNNHQLRGIPQQVGVHTITIRVVATNGFDAENPVTLTRTIAITARPRMTSTSIPPATVGASYEARFNGYASGVTAVGALPPGLTMGPSGVVSGMPEYAPGSGASASYAFRAAVDGVTASNAPFTINVASSTPVISTDSLAAGWTGLGYDQLLTAPFGADWTASGLPAGLAVSGDRITGTPTQSGTFSVVVTASRGTAHSVSRTLELHIGESAALGDVTLPRAVRGVAYDHALSILGDDVVFTGGSDAPGLVVAEGRISGTPTAAGGFEVTAVVENAGARVERVLELIVSDPGYTVSEVAASPDQLLAFGAAGLPAGDGFDVTLGGERVLTGVTASVEGTVDRVFAVPRLAPGVYRVETVGAAVPGSLELTVLPVLDTALPQLHYGRGYAGRIDSRYGGAVAVAAGSTLPPGLTLHPDGALEGTAGYDGVSPAAETRSIPITVNGVAAGSVLLPLVLDAPTLDADEPPRAVVDAPYVFAIPARGQQVDVTVAGELPEGLELIDSELVGIPVEPGEFALTVTAENRAGRVVRDVLLVVTRPTVTVSTGSIAPGARLDVHGEGFAADAEVAIWVHSDPVLLSRVTSDPDGRIRATVAIPGSLPPGLHRIEVRTSTGSYWAELTIVGGLARTGAEPVALLAMAAALIGGGVLLRRGGWRLRRAGAR
ncbi:putative Ig domain-containing protein [Protaetiibacter larvae]|uniref:Uncharacterized protein n=1 Tax=Protaetiibacter larvae TaxID=2592654 RepID=A0A5C1Y8Y3_9MICO|nr:putative Ig domain-containing protein [Protaetiibacter larvae]QEO09838.1 hypothetical protein FLP23_07345 [Protaetiibacter larvae]